MICVFQVNIISYDLMSRKKVELEGRGFKVIIMDESHFLKNPTTARTKAASPLLKVAIIVSFFLVEHNFSMSEYLVNQTILCGCPKIKGKKKEK